MSDKALLKRIKIISSDLYEWKQEAILHRDLATKAQEKVTRLQGLLERCKELFERDVIIFWPGDNIEMIEKLA